ncbi:PAS domain-containing sensor histidine kinase [Ramlibacter sp.]|uniref:PAS domain-containing sensor histidine kinase n=1 Tax=Ramlibacter sp. TaxID=1917967 RepID=UPI002D301E0B|nr:PAS domain-containing sensor histidine kinase [Ramlibacter sp.]HYD76487.1 PAS domain-containing sensor histidine kinase [Ramlibacter sp.]
MDAETSIAQLVERFLAVTREYAVICINRRGEIEAWLGGAAEIFGYEEHEVIGAPLGLLFTEEDRARGLDAQELQIAATGSRSEDDRWHVRKDGTRIWITGTMQAVRDRNGALLGYVKVARDRTDLQTRVERLEQRVAAAEASEMGTRAFVRTLGHEMRNPLTPLQNSAYILRKASSSPETVEKVAAIIEDQVRALRRMAEDLMDASRIELGKVPLHLETIDLRAPLHDICIGFQDSATSKGVDLTSLLPRGALYADVDRERFQQVMQNLIANAIRYTPAGGRVWVKATQEESDVVIRVQDTGVGIGAEMLPKLFTLFSREAKAEDLEPSGLGIGLAVVKGLVELHKGTVQARSSGAGKGSEFTVRLPVSSVAP